MLTPEYVKTTEGYESLVKKIQQLTQQKLELEIRLQNLKKEEETLRPQIQQMGFDPGKIDQALAELDQKIQSKLNELNELMQK